MTVEDVGVLAVLPFNSVTDREAARNAEILTDLSLATLHRRGVRLARPALVYETLRRLDTSGDRLDGASLPELEERQTELEELLTSLKAKVAWIKNPFLPQPIPPAGEKLLDPSLGPGQELELTRSRVFAVEGRLGKIRLLIQSGGSEAPALQP